MLTPTLYTGLAVNVNGIVYPCPSSTCPVILGKCVIIPYTPTCCDTGNFTPTCTPRLPSSSRITGGFANPATSSLGGLVMASATNSVIAPVIAHPAVLTQPRSFVPAPVRGHHT